MTQHLEHSDVDAQDLLDAVLEITSDLDLRAALDRLVSAACGLTGARYGVLGLLDDSGSIADFVIHGIPGHEIAQVGPLPTSKGLLGVLVEDPQPIRLADFTGHERSLGLPPDHPPMSTFLGVPVVVAGEVLGNLYLTEKARREEFSERDERVVQFLAQVAGFVIGNARTQLGTERRHQWLEETLRLAHAIEDSDDVPDALEQVVGSLCRVSGATLVAVVAADGEQVAVECSEGQLTEDEITRVLVEIAPAVDESRTSGTGVLRSVAQGTALCFPLPSRLVSDHTIVALLGQSSVFAGPDADLFTTYADQAALALDRTQGLSERQEHMLVADRDRIARDLHDTVIQRIFATALQLQGLRRSVLVEEVKTKLDEAVGELNTTIRDIRSTIFELKRDDSGSLKAEVKALAREYVPVLGFTPFVRLRGAIDGGVPSDISEQMVATLREALSNVARHADADACVVEVEVLDDWLTMRVSDNGRGITEMPAESGLRNVRRRAQDLGGKFSLSPEDPHGTLLEWKVPLRG